MIAAANPFTGKREQKASNGVPVGGFSVSRGSGWLPFFKKLLSGVNVIVRDRSQILSKFSIGLCTILNSGGQDKGV